MTSIPWRPLGIVAAAASLVAAGGMAVGPHEADARGGGLGQTAEARSESSAAFGLARDSASTACAEPPATFPYTPCDARYTVDVPASVTSSGFHEPVLGEDPTPKNVHVSFAERDTSRSFAVSWRTDTATLASLAVVGTNADTVASVASTEHGSMPGARVVRGHTMLFEPVFGDTTRVHEAHVAGLEPSTTYYYKVGGPGAWSRVWDVTTGPRLGARSAFRFAITGDSRNDAKVWPEVQRAVHEADVEFQIFTGDAVVSGLDQAGWNSLFTGETADGVSVAESLARRPFMPANGNHDLLTVGYVAQLALPQGEGSRPSPDETAPEEWYSFDYANAHFAFLNDSPLSRVETAQREWLRDDLRRVDRDRTPWTFVVHHRPSYSASSHGSDERVRAAFQPIVDAFGVDLVLNGHDHDYERSLPIRGHGGELARVAAADPNGVPVDGSGTIYVVTGGAGAELYPAGRAFHTFRSESVRHFIVVDIEGRTLRFRAVRLDDGSTLDAFELSK